MDVRPIWDFWDLFAMDSKIKPTVLKFDLIDGTAPSIVGLDVLVYTQIENNPHKPLFKFTNDSLKTYFNICITNNIGDIKRERLLLLPRYETFTFTLICSNLKGIGSQIANKLRRLTHARKCEMKTLLRDTDIIKIFVQYDTVYGSCNICASLGRLHKMEKISWKHVNGAFDECVQAGHRVIYINIEQNEVLNIVDAGPCYSKRCIAASRKDMKSMRICRLENLKRLAADPEFANRPWSDLRMVLKSLLMNDHFDSLTRMVW